MPEVARHCASGLLDTACEMMAQTGYAGMSMRQLALRLGLQAGSLYHHIPSKQDLLLDVLLDILAQRLAAWHHGPFSRDVRGYLRFSLERQRTHPAEEMVLRHEARHVAPPQRAWLEDAIQRLRAPLRQAILQHPRSQAVDEREVTSLIEAMFTLLHTADALRQREHPVDEQWLETWVLRMGLALLDGHSVNQDRLPR